MMSFKKLLSVAAVLALVVTAVPANVKAATADVVDFENGDFTGISMMLTDADSDQSVLSVADLDGSKALLVDKQEAGKIAKVSIDALALVGASNLDKVRAITFDVTVVNPDGAALTWNGGGIGAKIGVDGSVWYQGGSWEVQDDENSSASTTFTEKFVDGMGFTKDATVSGYLFMNWSGNLNDFYIDNVKFLDADGNALALAVAGAADDAAVTTEEVAATTDEAAATDVPKTGVVGLGLVYGLGAIATGAAVLKRKAK